jgi:hypothetical protein
MERSIADSTGIGMITMLVGKSRLGRDVDQVQLELTGVRAIVRVV